MGWFVGLQKLLPQHGLSRLVGLLGKSESDWVKRPFVHAFARAYDVNMGEAERRDLDDYQSFNDFFTRSLQIDARPIEADPRAIVSPADGAISQAGAIDGDRLLQAKGHEYTLASLAGNLAAGLEDGDFFTIYLAPSDYHRVHMPFTGRLTDTLAMPGALFSVNQTTEAGVEGLFCRNERLIARFETDFGPMLVIMVGALIVASIETVWDGPDSPYRTEQYSQHDLVLEKGDEMGRFLTGSTVICCFPKNSVELQDDLQPGRRTVMGTRLGETTTA